METKVRAGARSLKQPDIVFSYQCQSQCQHHIIIAKQHHGDVSIHLHHSLQAQV